MLTGLDLHRGHWGHGPGPRVPGGPISPKEKINKRMKDIIVKAKNYDLFLLYIYCLLIIFKGVQHFGCIELPDDRLL